MALSACLPLAVDRYGAAVRTIAIRGLDLTGVTLRAQVRLAPDTPGDPLIDLNTVDAANAEGLYLASAAVGGDGVMVSTVQIRINETTLEGLPYAGELGDQSSFAWDWQATIGGDKRRLAYGDFVVLPGVTGADNAATNRSPSYSPKSSASTWSSAQLTFGDETVAITIDGADMLAPLVAQAQTAADMAQGVMDAISIAKTQTIGKATTPINVAGNSAALNTYLLSTAAPAAATLALTYYAQGAGSLKVKRFTLSGGVYTVAQTIAFTTSGAGVQNFDASDFGSFAVEEGDYLGFYPSAGYLPYAGAQPDTPYVYAAGDATTVNAGTSTSGIQFQLGFTLNWTEQPLTATSFTAAQASIDDLTSRADVLETIAQQFYQPATIGRPGDVVSETGAVGAGTYVMADKLPSFGRWTGLRVWGGSGAATANLVVRFFNADDPDAPTKLTQVGVDLPVAIEPGENVITGLSAAVETAQFAGFWVGANGVADSVGTADGAGWWFGAGNASTLNVAAASTTRLFQIGFDFSLYEPATSQLPLLIVVDGDSLPAGAIPNGGTPPDRWSDQLAALMPKATIINVAVSGQDVDAMLTRAPTYVYPHGSTAGYRTVLIGDGEPYNQLRTGTSIDDSLAKLETYFSGARDAGFDLTIMIDATAHNTSTGEQVEGAWDKTLTKDQLNAAERAKWPNYNVDYLVDIGAAAICQDYTDSDNFQPDQVHWKTPVHTIIAQRLSQILAPYY